MKYTSIEDLYSIYKKHPRISKDTRDIVPSCIYFALKGESFDGNKFATEAIENGAAYAVIDNPEYQKSDQFILVEDSLKTLQELASVHRDNLNIPIIAITGSNGKTTTKELVSVVLNRSLKTHFTQGNYNNHIGVPLTLLQIDTSIEIAVIEMGANHIGEIDFLCNIAKPNYGLITNIGKAHIEGFGGIDGIKKGKTELYRYLEANNGIVFLNEDDSTLTSLIPKIETINYGKQNKVLCQGKLEKSHPTLAGSWNYKEKNGQINSSLYGEYNFYNILVAICIGNYFEINPSDIDEAISLYESKINRSQKIEKGSYTVYLDAYNANPTSMALAIDNFERSLHNNKVTILGDMYELGQDSYEEHLKIINSINASDKIQQALFVGDNFYQHKKELEGILFFKTVQEAKVWFNNNKSDSAFLIKGSRGMKMENILE